VFGGLSTLVVFFCFYQYFKSSIEFSQQAIIIATIFVLRGNQVKKVIALSTGCFILHINLLAVSFKNHKETREESLMEEELTPELFIPFLALIEIYLIVMYSFYIYTAERHKKLEFWSGN